ncbi:hypothetical protein F8M41_011143 [Gigaspora margarita]|uniref:Uncharacterized protein n=1 Tax=Gigaspora margarita TaxID=4874 RepID=A0A8H3X2G4_GIGMA|nr:hypothetical protein F8M41_011143 [Gigaspora margarita]
MNEDKEVENEVGAPQCGPPTSPFPDPAERRFCIEEYDKDLKKQKIVLDVLIEMEGSDRKKEEDLNQKEGDEYVNAELTEDSTSSKEGVESWYNSADEEKMILTTGEENEVFVIFVSDDNNKTVQEEEDLPKSPTDTVNEQIPRTISV